MSILKVAQLGNPILRNISEQIKKEDIASSYIQDLIDDMVETMYEYEGLGLAAPQVHESKSIIVIEAISNSRYPDHEEIPLIVLINPTITSKSSSVKEGWEGCLSLKGLRGMVKRQSSITIQALDRNGKEVVIKDDGFLAVVIQHEIDHLNGITFIDRIDDIKTLTFFDEYERYINNSDNEDES